MGLSPSPRRFWDEFLEFNCVPTDPNVQYLGIGRILFNFKSQPTRCLVSLPNWLSIVLILALASAVWFRLALQFSLRHC